MKHIFIQVKDNLLKKPIKHWLQTNKQWKQFKDIRKIHDYIESVFSDSFIRSKRKKDRCSFTVNGKKIVLVFNKSLNRIFVESSDLAFYSTILIDPKKSW